MFEKHTNAIHVQSTCSYALFMVVKQADGGIYRLIGGNAAVEVYNVNTEQNCTSFEARGELLRELFQKFSGVP